MRQKATLLLPHGTAPEVHPRDVSVASFVVQSRAGAVRGARGSAPGVVSTGRCRVRAALSECRRRGFRGSTRPRRDLRTRRENVARAKDRALLARRERSSKASSRSRARPPFISSRPETVPWAACWAPQSASTARLLPRVVTGARLYVHRVLNGRERKPSLSSSATDTSIGSERSAMRRSSSPSRNTRVWKNCKSRLMRVVPMMAERRSR